MKTEDITQSQFDNELIKILSDFTAAQLLDIPGIYDILSESFNNEVISNILNKEDTE